MCLSALSDGGGYMDDDRDCGALACTSSRCSVLPASVRNIDDLEAIVNADRKHIVW